MNKILMGKRNDNIGVLLDTDDILFGVNYTRNISDDNDRGLLSIGFGIITLNVVIKKESINSERSKTK